MAGFKAVEAGQYWRERAVLRRLSKSSDCCKNIEKKQMKMRPGRGVDMSDMIEVINNDQIKLIPHRAPFLLIDREKNLYGQGLPVSNWSFSRFSRDCRGGD